MKGVLLSHKADDADNPVDIRLRHRCAGGEAEAAGEEIFRDAAADSLTLCEDRLQVHGLPQRARLDVLGFQGQTDVFAVGSEAIQIDGDDGEPAVVQAPGSFGHEIDARKIIQRPAIAFEYLPFALHSLIQRLQLAAANARSAPGRAGKEIRKLN